MAAGCVAVVAAKILVWLLAWAAVHLLLVAGLRLDLDGGNTAAIAAAVALLVPVTVTVRR